jgi:hypothetical protein
MMVPQSGAKGMKTTRVRANKTEVTASPADFDENGALSREFLLRRGECCREGCRNCPYGFAAGREQEEGAPDPA